jgi:prepilin-type N-terminal cleavage/methylation domain-containing protein
MEGNKNGYLFVFIKSRSPETIEPIMKQRKIEKRGMTLIEVLVAMVILSIGVSSLMLAMSRCLGVVRTARHLDNARALFSLVEAEYPLIDKEMEEGTTSGDFADFEEFKAYTWQRDIVAIDAEERPGLFLITTRIIWSQKGRQTSQEIETFRYAPDAESVTSKF